MRERSEGPRGVSVVSLEGPGRKQEVARGERARATASCSYWQEEDDAVGWWAGLSTVLGHSWAD